MKEAEFRIGFTDEFRSASTREMIDRRALQQRFLLCLFGLGTNAGLKAMSAGGNGVSYADLLYLRAS
ncbi:MAG: Tn3 family transposase [Gammaproteobacteria bacterium]